MLWKLLFPTAIEIAKRHNSTSNRNAPPLSLCLHTTGVMIVIILVIGTIAMGLPLSPMLIQIAEATAEVPICNGIGPPTIVGTDNDDIIQGTEGNDLIAGLGGNDQIFGKGGSDIICGESDNVLGEAGDDRIDGGPGDDNLIGGPGTDRGDGGPDFDTCVNVETVINCEA